MNVHTENHRRADAPRKTLSIIGCGNMGKALARLWHSNATFVVKDVLNRSVESAQRAVSFIGDGRALERHADLRPADIFMIAATDDQIIGCCESLAASGLLSGASVVFHCSGALGSSVLSSARQQGASVASIHPIRSFSVPEQVAADFAGTYCGMEGEQRALDVLSEGFSAIGARLVPIDAEFKTIYHAAAVFASNYLVTLLDVAVNAYAKSGIPRDTALALIGPLVRKTVDNVLEVGPANALSGPIARGDTVTVRRQHRAVGQWDTRYATLYEQLGRLTAELAGQPHERFFDFAGGDEIQK